MKKQPYLSPIRGIISSELHEILARPHPQDATRTRLQRVCEKLVDQAEEGNLMATSMIFDRIEGRPGAQMDLNQAIQVLAAHAPEELAAANGIPAKQFLATKQQYLEAKDEQPTTEGARESIPTEGSTE